MTIEDLEAICDTFPGITKDIKWQEHLCFNIGGKMFLITSPDACPPTASFKTTPQEFEELIGREGIKPSVYTGKYNWVTLSDISLLTRKEWIFYARRSYDIIASKLSSKLKASLGL